MRYRKTMTVNLSGLVRCFCANTNRCNVRGHLLELPTRSCNKTTYLRLAGDAWQRRSIACKQLDKNSQHGGGTRQTYPCHRTWAVSAPAGAPSSIIDVVVVTDSLKGKRALLPCSLETQTASRPVIRYSIPPAITAFQAESFC